MTQLALISASLRGSVWEGRLAPFASGATLPDLSAQHNGDRLDGLLLARGEDGESLTFRVTLPPSVLSDGIQTIVLMVGNDHRVGSLSLIAGDMVEADIRAEVDLLRAELDMLKRAFRRHCVETGADR